MLRLIEILFGLDKGFLSKEGAFSLQFNPHWPGQQLFGAGVWNFLLMTVALLLVLYVYRHEGRPRRARIALGTLRMLVLLLVIAMLNVPVLKLEQKYTEPSVLAVLIDDSISMRIRDGADKQTLTRLEAAVRLFAEGDQSLPKALAGKHVLHFYRFDQDAQSLGTYDGKSDAMIESLRKLAPEGQHTQVVGSIRTVLSDLQGQRLAGVVVLSDGRDTPTQSSNEALAAIREYGVRVYPMPLGSDALPKNIELQSVSVQDAVFKGDIVNLKATVRTTGFEAGHAVQLMLKDRKTGQPLLGADGLSVRRTVYPSDNVPLEVELQFKPLETGPLDVVVEAEKQAGELDDQDNTRLAQLTVLDTKVVVLYVDGYPRWEYRYIKNEMMRDKTVTISCLLTSADPSFAQEGTKPIKQFPVNMDQLMDYDVVIFGDVDPRQFTDAQLQMVNEFVSRKGGGFGMVAGPQFSPQAYRNTALESLLPVNIVHVEDRSTPGTITQGFRLALTPEGTASSIFRFFSDREENERFIKTGLQPLFWYCGGVVTKAGVGEVYAEHPTDTGPDGRKSPILVMGRFGAGRTLFSAIDDSWRWRFYTGESVFDTYWVQQLRYLARGKKLGQRRLVFTTLRPAYELGQQVRLNLRVLDAQLLQQLPGQLRVEVWDEAGQIVRQESLMRQEGQNELYTGTWTADRIGRFVAKLPPVAGGVEAMELPIETALPRLELAQPQVDRISLSRLASETQGQMIDYADASGQLAQIPSAAVVRPVETSQPLWDAPAAMLLFVMLIGSEWVLRKMNGMV